MKKVMKSVFALSAALLLTLSALASPGQKGQETADDFKVGMYRIKDSLKMNLMMEKKEGTALYVRIFDSAGNKVMDEKTSKKAAKIAMKIDFEPATDGNYIIEITDGNDKIVKNVKLSTNQVVETSGRTLLAIN